VNTRMRTIHVIAYVVAWCACASGSQWHTPTASLGPEEARRTIVRCLSDQPPEYSAANVVVSPEKLTFDTQEARTHLVFQKIQINRTTTFYFDSLGEMKASAWRTGAIVSVFDAAGVYRFRVVIPDGARARAFMDSMLVMSLSASGAHQSPH